MRKHTVKVLLVVVLTLFITSTFIFPIAISGLVYYPENNYSTKALGDYSEDFTTTTYQDTTTSVYGWGTGSVLNKRNFTVTLLDFEPTPNPATSIAVQGRKVYSVNYHISSFEYSIMAFDINDPRDIRYLSHRDSLWELFSMAVDGDLLFGGRNNDPQGFNVYNIADPFNLGGASVYLDTVSTDGYITDIEVEGHLVYHTAYNSTSSKSLIIIDTSNPINVRKIIPSWSSSKALGLDINGQFAYVAASDEGFYILNISNKWSPIEVGHITIPGNATDVLVDGRYAYLVAGENGLFIIDVFDPTNPTILGSIDTSGQARQLVKKGNTIYIADGSAGVTIVDVANKQRPIIVTNIALPYAWDVDLYGGDLVVGTNAGIYTYRTGYIGNFAVDWFGNPLSGISAYDIRVQGDIAYIAAGMGGLITVNIQDPNNPIFLDSLAGSPLGFIYTLDIYGQFIIGVSYTGVYTFDVSNPANIKQTRYEFGGALKDVAMNGPMAYVAYGDGSNGGVGTLNYTQAFSAGWTGVNVNFGTNISSVAVQGKHIYTVDNSGFLGTSPYVHRISPNPALPIAVGSSTLIEIGRDVFIDGDLLFISDTNYLVLINVSDPTNPAWFGDFRFASDNIPSKGVWVDGNLVVSASGANGVHLLNSTNYVNLPITISVPGWRYPNATAANKITIHGDYVYVANESSLVILRHFKSAGATFIPGTAVAQSKTVSTAAAKITKATLNTVHFIQPDTTIVYYLSVDGGTTWEEVTPGVAHEFAAKGNDLRWKAEISGPEHHSAYLYELTIAYEYSDFMNFILSSWHGLPIWAWFAIGLGAVTLIIVIIVIIVKVAKKKKS